MLKTCRKLACQGWRIQMPSILCSVIVIAWLVPFGVKETLAQEAGQQVLAYKCRRVDAPIRIDGLLNEKAWERAAVMERFYLPGSHESPQNKTEVRMLWDDDNLYVGFVAYDDDICAWGKERDDNIFEGDVVEVFIKPSHHKADYYELNVNPENILYDAYYAYGQGGQTRFAKWNSTVVTAVKRFGTLDEWHDTDEKWQVEFRIPFHTLPSLKGVSPKTGNSWSYHVARYNYSVYLETRDPAGNISSRKGREIMSNVRLLGFHELDSYARLEFVR